MIDMNTRKARLWTYGSCCLVMLSLVLLSDWERDLRWVVVFDYVGLVVCCLGFGVTLGREDDMKRLIVDKSKWWRGRGSGQSRLLISADTTAPMAPASPEAVGKMCCLGFYCLSVGFTEGQITDVGLPYALLPSVGSKSLGWLLLPAPQELVDKTNAVYEAVGMDSQFTTNQHLLRVQDLLASVNDSPRLSDEARMGFIAEVFLEHAVVVEFA